MDGEELLQRYADGERDFSGVDLREAKLLIHNQNRNVGLRCIISLHQP